jgi:hypothetical protein
MPILIAKQQEWSVRRLSQDLRRSTNLPPGKSSQSSTPFSQSSLATIDLLPAAN